MHRNQPNLLSTYDGSTGAMSHLISGVERARQPRCKRLLRTQLTTASVMTRHMPVPPPVQKENFILEYVILENSSRVNNGVNNPIRLRHFDDRSECGNVNHRDWHSKYSKLKGWHCKRAARLRLGLGYGHGDLIR